MSKPKKLKGPARILKFIPIVPPNPKSRGSVQSDKRKKSPKHKTSWSRLDDLYQD